MTLLPDTRDLLNAAFKSGVALGRKFEVTDLTPELRQAARAYAASYEGDFEFVLNLIQEHANTGYYFSDGQSKALLNCLVADGKRRLAAKPSKTVQTPAAPVGPNVASIPDGRYRITLADGSDLALFFDSKNEWVVEKFGEGTRKISLRVGGSDSEREWDGVGTAAESGQVSLWKKAGPRVREAVEILASATRDEQGWLVFGLAFAQEGSRCFRCGKELDTPESLAAGYGPICASKLGLPWGAKVIPASVRLAQAAAQAAPEPAEQVQAPSVPEVSRPPVSLTEARQRGYSRTYEEIFGEDA